MEGNEGPLEVKYCVAISKVSEYKSGNILVKTHPPLRVVILESPQIVNVNDSIFIADPPSQPQKIVQRSKYVCLSNNLVHFFQVRRLEY